MSLALILFAEAGSIRSKLPMADWPDWLVILTAGVAVVLGLWILVKLLKIAVWLACIGIVIVGALLAWQWFLK